MSERSTAALRALLGLLTSLATALFAHVAIEGAGSAHVGADAYGAYAHVAFAPLALAALTIATALTSHAVTQRLGRALRADPLTLLLRQVEGVPFALAACAAAAGGVSVLTAMEFGEQTLAFGHVLGFTAALGGTPLVGLAIVAAAALLVAGSGIAALRLLVSTACAAVIALTSWLGARHGALAECAAHARGRRRRDTRAARRRSSHHGLRAPPRPA